MLTYIAKSDTHNSHSELGTIRSIANFLPWNLYRICSTNAYGQSLPASSPMSNEIIISIGEVEKTRKFSFLKTISSRSLTIQDGSPEVKTANWAKLELLHSKYISLVDYLMTCNQEFWLETVSSSCLTTSDYQFLIMIWLLSSSDVNLWAQRLLRKRIHSFFYYLLVLLQTILGTKKLSRWGTLTIAWQFHSVIFIIKRSISIVIYLQYEYHNNHIVR